MKAGAARRTFKETEKKHKNWLTTLVIYKNQYNHIYIYIIHGLSDDNISISSCNIYVYIYIYVWLIQTANHWLISDFRCWTFVFNSEYQTWIQTQFWWVVSWSCLSETQSDLQSDAIRTEWTKSWNTLLYKVGIPQEITRVVLFNSNSYRRFCWSLYGNYRIL